jgi:hypothetical protein
MLARRSRHWLRGGREFAFDAETGPILRRDFDWCLTARYQHKVLLKVAYVDRSRSDRAAPRSADSAAQ